MKKFINNLCVLCLLGVLCVACKGDYDDWAQPQNNEQEQPADVQMTVNVSAPAAVIELEALADAEQVQVFVPVKVESNVDAKYIVTLSDDNGNSKDFDATTKGYINKKELEKMIVSFYGKKQVEHAMNAVLTAEYTLDGSLLKKISEMFVVRILPAVPDMNYWIYGKQNNRDGEKKTLPLMPVSKVEQSVTTYFSGSLDTKLFSDDTFGGTTPFGASKGTNVKAMNGEFKDGGGYICPASAGWYKLTFRFDTYTYEFTKLDNQSPTEYSAITVNGVAMNQVSVLDNKWKSHCWYAFDVQLPAGTVAFHATEGADWTGQVAEAATYSVYFNDVTGEFLFIEAE